MGQQDSLIGTLFAGRFHIESLLGEGGMGAVYLARHTVLQRLFAVKVIRKSLITDLNVAARFRREARAASQVSHPHITTVFDFGHTDDGRPYLVMEYIGGSTLAEILAREGPLSVPRALNIFAQIADAIAAAHACGVVHRDLKPQNVLLMANAGEPDHVKILDFGLAKVVGLGSTMTLTLKGETYGTPEYMSPEQCMGGAIDHRSDIYSFGVLAFELLVGRVPLTGKTLVARVTAHLEQIPSAPSAASGRRELSPTLDAIVLRCLAKKPEDRYPDAVVLASEIRAQQQATGERPLVGRRPTTMLALRPTADLVAAELATSATVAHPLTSPAPAAIPVPGDGETQAPLRPAAELGGPELESQRSWALEELACAVRDQGLGSPEITEALALKLRAEDQVIEIEAELATLERELAASGAVADQREARLRQALIQLEQERARLPPDAVVAQQDLGKTLRWGSRLPAPPPGAAAWLEDGALEVTRLIQRISSQRDQQRALLQQRREAPRQALVLRRQEATRREQRLTELLRQARPQVEHLGDRVLDRLVSLADLEEC